LQKLKLFANFVEPPGDGGFFQLQYRGGLGMAQAFPVHQQGGLSSRQLDRSAATLLDVDTPADAAVLKRHPACPPELQTLDTWDRELGDRIDALMRLVTTPERELIVAGRVGAPVWSYLESQTACRVRMLAEERGMQAAGRDTSGEARTALGFLYREIGPAAFFARLGELGDGMLFDTRVLFAHLGWQPSAQDRFASDLFRSDALAHGELREFTAAARAAPAAARHTARTRAA